MTTTKSRTGDPIEIRRVDARSWWERRKFLTFPWRIYEDDPLWVPPLLPQLDERIDPDRGVFFDHGQADFFMAYRGGEPVGTICAGEDYFKNESKEQKDCVFGFFEVIEDYTVAEALLNRAIAWAEGRGLDALFGPFNLDYEDSYGVLIEGRERPPALLCGHTPSYYQGFLERFGCEPARGDNLAYKIDLGQDSSQLKRLSRLGDYLRRKEWIEIRGANLDEWDTELDRIHRLLNAALAHLPDHMGWHRDDLEESLQPFRDLADPELVLFAEVEGETVGWFPAIPDLNEALIKANGLRYPWDYVRLWWAMRQDLEWLTIKSVLVLPEYWQTGVSVLLFDEMRKRARERGYRWVDLSLTGADNPFTPDLAERLGAELYKRYRVYRYYL